MTCVYVLNDLFQIEQLQTISCHALEEASPCIAVCSASYFKESRARRILDSPIKHLILQANSSIPTGVKELLCFFSKMQDF